MNKKLMNSLFLATFLIPITILVGCDGDGPGQDGTNASVDSGKTVLNLWAPFWSDTESEYPFGISPIHCA